MIKLSQAVIVEGKYDKIKLEGIIDATIIATNGFGIFKDRQKRELIRMIAVKRGIVVMTDSDNAGGVIRSHLKQICPEGTVTNVYVPQLKGKESRKSAPSKQGLLGVEGLDKEVILNALAKSGITENNVTVKSGKKITKADLYNMGLSGGKDSAALRKSLAMHLNLPTNLSPNAFLDCINIIFEFDEFFKAVELWRQEEVKR